MTRTRCKFKCRAVTENEGGSKEAFFYPVVTGSEENKSFWKYTPGGELKLHCLNPDVVFVPGKEYYIDISLAE